MCPHTTICRESSCCYMCVLVLLYMCPHIAICVYSYCYICVLILLYVCPRTAIYVSSYRYICICVLKTYMAHDTAWAPESDSGCCPHTAICVSSYYYICVLVQLYVKRPHTTLYLALAYYYRCVFILLYRYSYMLVSPHTTIFFGVWILPYIYSYMRVSAHTTMYLASAYYYVCVHSKHVIGLLYGSLSK
jgi:hypothetical protein